MPFIRKLVKLLIAHWQAFLFTFSRYFSLGGIMIALLICAKRIGPVEMSYSIPVFLYITYANYLGIGGCLVLCKKYYSLNNERKRRLLNAVFRWYLLAAIISIPLAFVFLDNRYAFYTGIVTFVTFYRSYIEAYLRLEKQILVISLSDILMSTLTLILTLTLVSSFSDYIKLYAVSKLLSLIIYIICTCRFLFQRIKDLFEVSITLNYYYKVINLGLKLGFISIMSSLLLSIDKFYANKFGGSPVYKGSYQLSETIAMICPILINAFAGYFFPDIVQFIKKGRNNEKKYIKTVMSMSIIILPVSFLLSVLTHIVNIVYYQQYMQLGLIVFFLCSAKMSTAFIVILLNCYIANNAESLVIKILFPVLIAICIIDTAIMFYELPIIYYAVSSFICINISFVYSYLNLKNNLNRVELI